MVCSEQCSMCIMSEQVQMQVYSQLQGQCVMYTVQCVGCTVLPAKDADLAVKTG